MKNKVIVLIIMILMLCGCESNSKTSKDDYAIWFYTDSETCVEYVEYGTGYGKGLSVRYNTDGTIRLNEECINGKK